MMKINQPATIVAVLLSTLGILALPHAMLQDYGRDTSSFQNAALPYLVGLAAGIALWWARQRSGFDVRRIAPGCWLALAIITILVPLTWPDTDGRHQYPGGIDPILLALPFIAAWLATLDDRLGRDRPPLGWFRALIGAGLVALSVALILASVPSVHALFLPALLLLAGNASVRRVGWLSVLGAGLLFLVMMLARPYRVVRLLDHGVLPYRTMFEDIYGAGYQHVNMLLTLRDMGWFGADTLVHLPEASRQLMTLSMAAQWGGLALAGVFLMLATWFVLVRPGRQVASANHQVSRMLWWSLLYFALINLAGSLLLISPFGPGMVMVSPNVGLIVLAWLVMALQTRDADANPVPTRWVIGMLGAWLFALFVYVAVMPAQPAATESAAATQVAAQALDKAMRDQGAEFGSAVILDANNGAVLAQIGRRGLQASTGVLHQYSFPPGATLLPFLAGALLDRGLIKPDTPISTQPLTLQGQVIKDSQPMPANATLRDVLALPSQVGAAHLALQLPAEEYLGLLSDLGFGRATDDGPLGESYGRLPDEQNSDEYDSWGQARLGIADEDSEIEVNLTQLAQAYLALTGDGTARRAYLNPYHPSAPAPRLFTRNTTRSVRAMLTDPGTLDDQQTSKTVQQIAGQAASISTPTRWGEARSLSLYIGFAPVDSPRYLVAAMVERRGDKAGLPDNLAAPVVREILTEMLRQGGQP